MVKKSLAALVRHKLRLDPRHRVGLAVLANDASLVQIGRGHIRARTNI